MSSPNPQSPESVDKSESTPQKQAKQKWSITPQAFDKFLEALAPDREEAGKEYERVRAKLIRFFEWRTIGPSDDCADEAFNRVARRIDEGQRVDDLMAYIFGVARLICLEVIREREKEPAPLDETRESQFEPAPQPPETQAREECFDCCMEKLPSDNRRLILEYYQEERRAKIQLRQQIADRLSIELNALRIRVHRIRISLERCIRQCLETSQGRND